MLRSVGCGTLAYQDSNWESLDSESRVMTVWPCTQFKTEVQTLAFVAENFQCKSVLALGCSAFLFCCFAVCWQKRVTGQIIARTAILPNEWARAAVNKLPHGQLMAVVAHIADSWQYWQSLLAIASSIAVIASIASGIAIIATIAMVIASIAIIALAASIAGTACIYC